MRDPHPRPHYLAAMRKGDLFQSGDTAVLVNDADLTPNKDALTMCVEADIAPYSNQSKDPQARLADASSTSASILRSLRNLLAQGVTLPSSSSRKLHLRGVGVVVPEPRPSSSGSASSAAVGAPAQPAFEAADVHTSGASSSPMVSVQLFNARSTTAKTLDLTHSGTPAGHPTSIQGGVGLASSIPTAIDTVGTYTTAAADTTIAKTATTTTSSSSSKSSSRSVVQDGSKGRKLIKKLKHAAAACFRGYQEGMSETSYAVTSSSAMLALWPCILPEPPCGLQFRYNPYDPYNYAREYHY